MNKIKVGIVNYLNTAPLIYGLENAPVRDLIELVPDYPSNLALDLKEGKIDLGLVPVAVIPELKEWHIVGDYCIGCDGPVASVCLFSEVPVEKVERVLLDYQSNTSVELAKILLKDYWKVDPELVMTKPGYRQDIAGTTAGLVIGDRALEQRKISPFVYDLGKAWKVHTGLPFVFAAWVSNKRMAEDFETAFNEANKTGLQNIDRVVEASAFRLFNLTEYYTKFISYHLDDEKRKGLDKFLSLLNAGINV